MTNNVVLVGRLVRNVELRQTSTGKEMTYFTLAVNRNFQGNDGKTVYVTEVVASSITFLESKKQQGNTNQYGQTQNGGYSQQANNDFGGFEDNIDFNMGWNPFQED
nr:MAG TPA: Single strand binding protein [Caudoviricetes sp.]